MIYIIARNFTPVECRALHRPIDEWAWYECPDISSLLRDFIHSIRLGHVPILATPRGVVDIMNIEKERNTLENPILSGCIMLIANFKDLETLIRYATRIKIRKNGNITACFKEIPLEKLIKQGHIPLIWRSLDL